MIRDSSVLTIVCLRHDLRTRGRCYDGGAITINELRDDMIIRFERVDSEFAKMRAEMKAGHETTRRHFEVWAEKMNDSVKIVAEATAHQTVSIDDHEKRLKRLERPRPRRTE